MAIRRVRLLVLLLTLAVLPAPAQVPVSAAPASDPLPLVAHAERRRTYDVLHYDIALRFDERERSVSGTTTVRLAPLAPSLAKFGPLGVRSYDLFELPRGSPIDRGTFAQASRTRSAISLPGSWARCCDPLQRRS